MLEYERIDFSEGIGVNKTNLSKECDVFHYIILLLYMLRELLIEFIFGISVKLTQLP